MQSFFIIQFLSITSSISITNGFSDLDQVDYTCPSNVPGHIYLFWDQLEQIASGRSIIRFKPGSITAPAVPGANGGTVEAQKCDSNKTCSTDMCPYPDLYGDKSYPCCVSGYCLCMRLTVDKWCPKSLTYYHTFTSVNTGTGKTSISIAITEGDELVCDENKDGKGCSLQLSARLIGDDILTPLVGRVMELSGFAVQVIDTVQIIYWGRYTIKLPIKSELKSEQSILNEWINYLDGQTLFDILGAEMVEELLELRTFERNLSPETFFKADNPSPKLPRAEAEPGSTRELTIINVTAITNINSKARTSKYLAILSNSAPQSDESGQCVCNRNSNPCTTPFKCGEGVCDLRYDTVPCTSSGYAQCLFGFGDKGDKCPDPSKLNVASSLVAMPCSSNNFLFNNWANYLGPCKPEDSYQLRGEFGADGPFVPVKVDSPFKVLLRAQVFQNSQDPPGNCYSWDAFIASNKPEDVIVDALRSLVKGPNGATSTDLF